MHLCYGYRRATATATCVLQLRLRAYYTAAATGVLLYLPYCTLTSRARPLDDSTRPSIIIMTKLPVLYQHTPVVFLFHVAITLHISTINSFVALLTRFHALYLKCIKGAVHAVKPAAAQTSCISCLENGEWRMRSECGCYSCLPNCTEPVYIFSPYKEMFLPFTTNLSDCTVSITLQYCLPTNETCTLF